MQHPVGDDHAGGDTGLALEPTDQVEGLGDRHLLGRRHDDHAGGRRVAEDVEHPARLVAHEPDLHEVADHLRRTELGDDVAGRLGVDHDQVVRALAHLVAQLADAEDLLDAWRRVGDEVERASERTDAPEQRDPHEQPEVLAQRVLGVHRHRQQVRLDQPGLEVQRRRVEGVGERALGVHLAHERATAGAGREMGDGGRDRRLADTSLAGDEEELAIEQWGRRRVPGRTFQPSEPDTPVSGAPAQPPKPMRRSPSGVPTSM